MAMSDVIEAFSNFFEYHHAPSLAIGSFKLVGISQKQDSSRSLTNLPHSSGVKLLISLTDNVVDSQRQRVYL